MKILSSHQWNEIQSELSLLRRAICIFDTMPWQSKKEKAILDTKTFIASLKAELEIMEATQFPASDSSLINAHMKDKMAKVSNIATLEIYLAELKSL